MDDTQGLWMKKNSKKTASLDLTRSKETTFHQKSLNGWQNKLRLKLVIKAVALFVEKMLGKFFLKYSLQLSLILKMTGISTTKLFPSFCRYAQIAETPTSFLHGISTLELKDTFGTIRRAVSDKVSIFNIRWRTGNFRIYNTKRPYFEGC